MPIAGAGQPQTIVAAVVYACQQLVTAAACLLQVVDPVHGKVVECMIGYCDGQHASGCNPLQTLPEHYPRDINTVRRFVVI